MSCACKATPADPAAAADDGEAAATGCSGGESFALRVLGDDMAPEFNDGDIIIVEPDGALRDGCFVLARHEGEWVFRQLCQRGPTWALHAMSPSEADLPLADLTAVHGVVIQKAVPGRRRLSKFYI